MTLSAGQCSMLLKCLEMTQSEHDGEVLNAIRQANKLLKRADVCWAVVLSGGAASEPPIEEDPDIREARELLAECNDYRLSDNDRRFFESLDSWFKEKGFLTVNQLSALYKMRGRTR